MIEINPIGKAEAKISVPGSKSLTQRALIAAALASGESRLIGPLESEDTEYSSKALAQMGVTIDKGDGWHISGNGGVIHPTQQPIYLGNNGTATRFLTSVASLGNSRFIIDGDKRMYEYGIDLGLSGYLTVIGMAVLASIGTAGVPGVGLIMLAMVFNQVGLPVEGIGLILGVDRLLDMTRTAVNVTGDAAITTIVAKSEGSLDEGIFDDPNAGNVEDIHLPHRSA